MLNFAQMLTETKLKKNTELQLTDFRSILGYKNNDILQ